MGDLNGRAWRGNDGPVVGKFGEETINDNGERLVYVNKIP
jgi:hypothetical protein